MAEPVVAAGILAAGYVLGTLPTALVVGRWTGHDPTAEGSGNPGASNVFRTAGRRAGALVLVGDLAKGAAAAGLGLAAGHRGLALAAGLAAVLGHVAPITRPAHGGKGVATAAGVVAVAFPVVGIIAIAGWLLVVKLTDTASIASLFALALVVPAAAVLGAPAMQLWLVAAMVSLVVARHAGNIARLAHGDEARLGTGRP